MTRPDLVIFDCDGVLVDSEPIANALLQQDLSARGLRLGTAEIDRLFTGGTMPGVAETARAMGARIPDDWVQTIYDRLHARLAAGVAAIAGVEAVLDRLDAAGVPYCVGSNGSLEKMAITLGQHAGLIGRLQGRLYSAHVHRVAKPDPELFLIAARDFGVAPGRCAVIDDSPAGCTAGMRAGMAVYGFAETGDGARLAALGATVFRTMGALPELLGI